jgi:hypothetical protein
VGTGGGKTGGLDRLKDSLQPNLESETLQS